ncbi:MAG: aminotransferase class I and II [Candidatus Aminicenantes bacterium RBG_13_59_9]|jgi:aspartate/methionine/tyrosine aminotransferase|nr:MAG: aminotransferase class I and II [Candidatus Aminicenantes bacterium RBG_13_59_9]
MISEKVNQIGASPTLKISAKAKAMRAEGIDIVDLSVGEPDFPTPENAKAAGIRAIQQNFTKYTENEGIPALKKAVLARMKEDCGLDYDLNQVIVSPGAKASLFLIFQALIDEGEEVIIPAPYWVTYPMAVILAKGKPVIVRTKEENGFVMTPEELKAAINPSTKAIILNNPSNPTGAAYSKAQLEALAEVVRKEDVFVIADEIYGKLIFDDFEFRSFASLGEDIKKKTVVVNGVSKSYSMTGWRIGYALGPAEIINGMAKVQSHSTSNPCSISQYASLEALSGPQYEISKMVAEFQRRRNYCLMRLRSIPNVSCFKPQGAFYLLPNFSAYFDREAAGVQIRNSYGLAYYLLKEARVAIVPGDSFGADSHIRLSYATSMENLEKGLDRISEAMAKLKAPKKVRRVALSNAVTRVKKSVPVEAGVTAKVRDALVAEMDSHLTPENYYEWNANISGVVVQLRTNVSHLYDFWVENWYPAQIEADLEPHGIIYAVDGIAGREPRVFYNSETKTGVIVNADNYGPLRSLALGLVMDASERLFGVCGVRGMSADAGGKGLILVGPPGTRKTELFYELLEDKRLRLHANDIVFVRQSAGKASADCVERKLFMATNTVESFPRLASLFDGSKCENVVTHKDDCKNADCLRQDDCRLDRGSLFCYKASPEAHAMLDPYWIGGKSAYAKRTELSWIFILRNDPVSPAAVKLSKDEALRILETGESAGAKKALSPAKPQPFYNPHLLFKTGERLDLQKAYFDRLLDAVSCYLFNSGAGGASEIKKIIWGEE